MATSKLKDFSKARVDKMEATKKKRKRRRLEPELVILEDDCLDMVVWRPPAIEDDDDCVLIPEWMFSSGNERGMVEAYDRGHLPRHYGIEAEEEMAPPVQDDEDCCIIPQWMFCVDKDTQSLLTFQTHVWGPLHAQCIQEEEQRARVKERAHKRPDIKAWEKIRQQGRYHFPEPQIGVPPGLFVGYTCYSRGEMAATGLHRKIVDGIDFIPENTELIPNEVARQIELPVAISIVMSGGYEDDRDDGDTIIYTGQGGRNSIGGKKRQATPQTLNEANRAMEKSKSQNLPIRVMRGHKPKTYTYSGLYQIVESGFAPGLSGHLVFKFKLKRLPGQVPLPKEKVQFQRR